MTDVRPLPRGGFAVHTKRTGGRTKGMFTAGQVVFSAAALGTQRLLHRLRDRGRLPAVSDRLGMLSRTNSEAVLAAKARGDDVDHSDHSGYSEGCLDHVLDASGRAPTSSRCATGTAAS